VEERKIEKESKRERKEERECEREGKCHLNGFPSVTSIENVQLVNQSSPC
jgi:hypothetical protein